MLNINFFSLFSTLYNCIYLSPGVQRDETQEGLLKEAKFLRREGPERTQYELRRLRLSV